MAVSKTEIYCKDTKVTHLFPIEQVVKLLTRQDNKGRWVLPKDSIYKLHGNGLKLKRSKKTDSEAEA